MFLSNSSIARSGDAEKGHIASAKLSAEKACSPPDKLLSERARKAPCTSCEDVSTIASSRSASWLKINSPERPLCESAMLNAPDASAERALRALSQKR